MHYQEGGLVRLNGFFASSFLGKLPRPYEEGKIVGRSLILNPLRGAIVFAAASLRSTLRSPLEWIQASYRQRLAEPDHSTGDRFGA